MKPITPKTVSDAKQGSQAELAALVAHMMPCIRHNAAQNVGPGLEFEDAVQEGVIALFQAICTYQEQQGASFETYAAVCIRNGIVAARRAAQRKKHGPLNYSLPLTEQTPTPGPEELAIQQEGLNHTLELIQTQLSDLEQTVLELTLDGNNSSRIAQKLGCTQKTVENALFRARRKLRRSQQMRP